MSELSEQEIQAEIKKLQKASREAKAAREAKEAKAEAVRKASAKLGSDALYGPLAAAFGVLGRELAKLKAVATPAGAQSAEEVSKALGRASGLLASSARVLTLTDAERALCPKPAPAPVAKKVAKKAAYRK